MDTNIEVFYALSESRCWDTEGAERFNESTPVRNKQVFACKHDGHIILDELKFSEAALAPTDDNNKSPTGGIRQPPEHPIATIRKDGIYIFQLRIDHPAQKPFQANVHIEIKATYGYLSAIDWPLLLVSQGNCKCEHDYFD